MTYILKISPVAKRDILSTYSYIRFSLNNTEAANEIIKEINEKIFTLREFPYVNPEVQTSSKFHDPVRKMQVKNYFVFYSVIENEVYVLRICHTKEDWKKFF